jgi:hypothetical protein
MVDSDGELVATESAAEAAAALATAAAHGSAGY